MTLNQIKERYSGVQDLFKGLDTDGCLLLSLCTIIEEVTGKSADLVDIVHTSRLSGWLSNDYTVENSLAILNHFTGKEFKRKEIEKLPEKINDNDYTVEKWYNKATGYTHFRRRDRKSVV